MVRWLVQFFRLCVLYHYQLNTSIVLPGELQVPDSLSVQLTLFSLMFRAEEMWVHFVMSAGQCVMSAGQCVMSAGQCDVRWTMCDVRWTMCDVRWTMCDVRWTM